jgi:superfamily II DNA or RNA helicase
MTHISEIQLHGEREARWYQVAALNQVVDALRRKVMRILVALPTGAGKTFTSGLIFSSPDIRKLLKIKKNEKMRILFIAHKHRLLTQAEREFEKMGIIDLSTEEKEYASEANVELILQSAFSSIPQEVLDRGWDLTVIDEAHHEAMLTIQYKLEMLTTAPIIGLTATPDRADGCLIKFEEIVHPITRQEAVEQGYLAPTTLYSFVDTPVRNKAPIIIDILRNYHDKMGQSMIFVSTKNEVRNINAWLIDNGFNSVALLEQSEREFNRVLDAFQRKEYQFVVNCAKISEGVDIPNCESVVLGRQYGSYPQLNQVIGRASRIGSDCRVWELINPLSGRNLDTTVVVGTPEDHYLIYKQNGVWNELEFDYTRIAA